jgi:hypothetical protein
MMILNNRSRRKGIHDRYTATLTDDDDDDDTMMKMLMMMMRVFVMIVMSASDAIKWNGHVFDLSSIVGVERRIFAHYFNVPIHGGKHRSWKTTTSGSFSPLKHCVPPKEDKNCQTTNDLSMGTPFLGPRNRTRSSAPIPMEPHHSYPIFIHRYRETSGMGV